MPPSTPLAILSDVTAAEWKALAGRQVFFGHQSVGENVMQGMSEILATHPEIPLVVRESKDLGASSAPGLYHAAVGRNYHPAEKSREFVEIASRSLAPGGIGMVKYCFVDVEGGVNPDSLFQQYRADIDGLKRLSPGLTIVHFTMPLHAIESLRGYWKQRLLGHERETQRALNAVRNRYNTLLLEAYGGREPVFDIAALETRRSDGSRMSFTRGGETFYALADELTTDGGHLNESARRMVAEQLLIFLARLPAPARKSIG